MVDRISTLDNGYQTGDLSVYPEAIDNKETLYEAKNNAETVLTKTLSYNGKFILVEDTSPFPMMGLIRVGNELIYYSEKNTGSFKNIKRGFAGSIQNKWPMGTAVSHAVMAEPHNAVKDAIINIENFLGTSENPADGTIHAIVKELENRFLAPKPIFRASPLIGPPPLKVRFQNFSNKEAVRFLWDFGDGGTSTENNVTHTYLAEGVYTVQLRMITSLGGQGVIVKQDYITVSADEALSFMYVTPEMGTTSTTFAFVDQTDGDIVSRHWIFDDGTRETVEDPDIHTITHTYSTSGEYNPSLLVVFADNSLKQISLGNSIIVT